MRVSTNASQALMTVEDVAGRHRVTTTTVRRWIKAGKLRALRMSGGTLRIAPEDLLAFEQQHGTIPAQRVGLEPEEWAGYTDAATLGTSAAGN